MKISLLFNVFYFNWIHFQNPETLPPFFCVATRHGVGKEVRGILVSRKTEGGKLAVPWIGRIPLIPFFSANYSDQITPSGGLVQ